MLGRTVCAKIVILILLLCFLGAAVYAGDAPKPDYTVRFVLFAVVEKSQDKPVSKDLVPSLIPDDGLPIILESQIKPFRKQMEKISRDYKYEFVIRGDAYLNDNDEITMTTGLKEKIKAMTSATGTVSLKIDSPDIAVVNFKDMEFRFPKRTAETTSYKISTERKLTIGRTYAIGGTSGGDGAEYVLAVSVEKNKPVEKQEQ